MGNLEKPLTWILVIGLLGYLFVANCTCGEEIPPPPPDPVTETTVEGTIEDSNTTVVEDSNTTVIEKTELITKEE